MSSFSNARILVAGGSGVLGGEVARVLASEGARILLAGRDETRLNRRSSQLGSVPTLKFDLRSADETSRMVEAAAMIYDGLDGLINAAGVVAFGQLADMSVDALDEIVLVNLTGPLRMIRSAIPHIENGFVVNITGVVAEKPMSGLAAYSASKAGLSAASAALTRELRREGIRFIDARPPHTETGLADRPLEGTPPRMPEGLDPAKVAELIVEGIRNETRQLESADFG